MRVSVVIPTFNRARLLGETIDSVARQTFRDYELIVVDDGSTDATADIVGLARCPVRYVKQQNRGVNAARNLAVNMARGEFIALLDDDDLWFEHKLALQVQLLDRFPDIGFVYSNFSILKPTGAVISSGLDTWYRTPPAWTAVFERHDRFSALGLSAVEYDFEVYRGDIYYHALFDPCVLPTTAVFRRRYFGNDLKFDETDPICGDWEFFARLSRRWGALFMDIDTAINRSHEGATRLTRTPAHVQTARRLAMVQRVWRADAAFCERYRADVDRVERRLLQDLATRCALAGDVDAAEAAVQAWDADAHGALPRHVRWLVAISRLSLGRWAMRTARGARSQLRRLLSRSASR